MTPATLFMLLVGMVALIGGAELMVRGSSRMARAFGMSPLLVGLTLVAFGTSAPEIAVSVQAALAGRGGVAIGNVAGSNIFNVLAVIGLSAFVAPLLVEKQLVRLDVPVLIVVSALPILLGWNGRLGRAEGVALFALGLVYTGTLAVLALRDRGSDDDAPAGDGDPAGGEADTKGGGAPDAVDPRAEGGIRERLADAVMILVGVGALVLGAHWLVDAASTIALSLGVSELVIGLTLVAGATSLPELATSLVAALRGERDMAVGNAVGSNIFNILFVLGAASVAAPDGLPVPSGALTFDFPLVLLAAVVCLPVFFTGFTISRWEGAVFFAYYVIYLAYILLDASTHHAEDEFVVVVVGFVVPLTAILLVGGWWWGRGEAESASA